MRMPINITNTKRNIAILTIAMAPCDAVAGSFGATSVPDSSVSLHAPQGKVWCQKLKANIPLELEAQMDCGAVQAAPRVAGERVRNNPLGSFFGRHKRGAGPAVSLGDGPNTTPKSNVTSVATSDPTPTPTASVGKWERLGELGVTQSNFDSQPDSFKDSFNSYDNEPGGDWSGFNPGQENRD